MSILLITGISVSVVFALFAQRSVVGSTECYSCVNSTAASKCSSVVSCKIGEICFADHITTIGGLSISLGCMPEASCSSIVTGNISIGGSLIGRSTSVGDCSECCRQNRCNRQLCQSSSDGSWSSWLEWSHCDVSCGNGTQSRIRKCTEPSPSGGGKDCSGTSKQTVICSAAPCPVHGQWSTWTSWGACSSTCGIGLQRRDRSCSNPYPSPNGDHCFGDSRDDKICMETACAETDGGWSVWSVWTACSTTCNTGLQTRQRQCNNPVPSSGGLYCKGSPMDVVFCNRQHCPRAKSSFKATGATPQSTGILSFSTVKLNEGSYFDGGSGTFTCQLSGLYLFTATIVEGGGTDNIVNCIIRKNAVAEVSFYYRNGVDSDGRRPQNGYGVATGSATLHLTNRDRVNIMCGTDTLSVSLSSFTGFLIAEDP